MKVFAFGASGSRTSVNQTLALFAANKLPSVTPIELTTLEENDFDLPLFTSQQEEALEQETGNKAHPHAQSFLDKIQAADVVIVSFAEHNGNYSAAFKNLFDWSSRIEQKMFQNKPTLLLATSPGARGGKSVLEIAEKSLPRFGAAIVGALAIPSFFDAFDENMTRLRNDELSYKMDTLLQDLANYSR
ncbi:NADPH-dependent FMN reductase [Marinomonas algicola]|uniref:NADPH-dependent FMN reductase n=1 Tax=Marinomonas algicola TaxID=2773454 RepID=UPI00174EB797|nr:NAD(P)H-dependent oxidoreductase [Marinomonas algicola]